MAVSNKDLIIERTTYLTVGFVGLLEFQVRLVVGPASRASLREAGASGAKMIVVRAGKSFPEQEASDADAEHIGQLVEVRRNLLWFFCCRCLYIVVSRHRPYDPIPPYSTRSQTTCFHGHAC